GRIGAASPAVMAELRQSYGEPPIGLESALTWQSRLGPRLSLQRSKACAALGQGAVWHVNDGKQHRKPSFAQLAGGIEVSMRYLHTMVRVTNIDQSLDFYCKKLGMQEVRRVESEAGKYTLVFLAAPEDKGRAASERAPLLELTFNWDPEKYGEGRNFGHLAYEVDDIYAVCDRLLKAGVTV